MGIGKGLNRLVLGLCGLFVASIAWADLTAIEVENAYMTGTLSTFPMPNPTTVTSGEGGTGLNLIPLTLVLTRKPNAVQPSGWTSSVLIVQTKYYIGATNQFVSITPRTILEYSNAPMKFSGSDTGQNMEENSLGGKFFKVFSAAPYNTDEYKFGRYQFQIKVSAAGGPFATVFTHDFLISPIGLRDSNADGGTDPFGSGSGGGITADDLNEQNINQEGFWEGIFSGLFIPDEETLNVFKDTLLQFGTWGPFGIIQKLHDKGQEWDVDDGVIDYTIAFTVPMVGTVEMDLNPYETWIRAARFIGAVGLWWIVCLGLWRKVFQKV